MRVLGQSLLRRGNADRGKQFDAAPFRRQAVKLEMLLQRLDELSADGQHWIQGRHRVLEYDRDRAAAQFTKAFGLKTHEILPIEQHAPRQFGFFRQQLQDRARQHGFSAARFPDNSKGAAGADSQTYLIDRAKIAARGRQIDRDIFDGK